MDISRGKYKSSTITLFDITSQTMFILYPSGKTVKGPIRPDESKVALGKKRELPPYFKTGKTEVIAGLRAAQLVQEYEDGKIDEAWESNEVKVSHDLKLGLIPLFGNLAFKGSSSIADKDGWILRKVRRWSDGTIWSLTEVTKIEHILLSEDIFEIPPDYKNVEEHHQDHEEDSSEDIKKYSY